MKEDFCYAETIGLLVHSYNNHLAAMIGFTELAILESEQDSVKRKLNFSLASGNEAAQFGRQLLSSVARLPDAFSKVSMNHIVASIPSLMLEELPKKIGSAIIQTNLSWFSYCLQMLIDFSMSVILNNVKQPVAISQPSDYSIQIVVYCPSLSLSAQQQAQLFHPFYSITNLTDEVFTVDFLKQNKGVGLAVVSGFVEQMKGQIRWVEGKGFVLNFPIFSAR